MGLGMVIYQLIGRSGTGVALSLLGEQQASPDTRWMLLMLCAEIQDGQWSTAASPSGTVAPGVRQRGPTTLQEPWDGARFPPGRFPEGKDGLFNLPSTELINNRCAWR